MNLEALHPGAIITGPALPEPVEVLAVSHLGPFVKISGKGLNTKQVREPVLSEAQLVQLTISAAQQPFSSDPARFRLDALGLGRSSMIVSWTLAPTMSSGCVEAERAETGATAISLRYNLLAELEEFLAAMEMPAFTVKAA